MRIDAAKSSAYNEDIEENRIELLYLWIGTNETGFIYEQGFNFSPNYRFDLLRSEDQQHFKLTCIPNEDYPDVWNSGSIIGLTAIVGENGTGKSSLMRYMMDPDFRGQWLRIYRVNKSIEIYHSMDSIEFDDTMGYNVHNEQDYRTQIFHAQTRVYISNAWNSLRTAIDEEDNNFDRLVFSPDGKEKLCRLFCIKMEDNIPAYPEQNSPYNSSYSRPQRVGNIDIEELITLHYYSHLFSDNTHDIASIPQNSVISFNFYDNLYRQTRRLCTDDVRRRFLEAYGYSWTNTPCYAAYFALYLEFCISAGIGLIHHNPAEFIQNTFTEAIIPSGMSQQIWDYYYEAYNEIVELEKLLKNWDNRGRTINGRRFITKLYYSKEVQRNTFIDFCHYISSLMYKPRSFVLKYIHIDTAPVSSGEQALRNIFASLQIIRPINTIFGVQSDITLRKNILLLLDEVDLYMHPEWQRKFLTLLDKRLRIAYPDHHIQLVITTHSPLVLSDIPSRNIIYLDKCNNQCIVAKGPEHQETFGANIFTLLKDSFYLERSLGEFSYSKINEVITNLQLLKENSTDAPPRKECEKYIHLINIIGEPIIRRKLQTLYFELFTSAADDSYAQQITDLARALKNADPQKREKYKALLDKILFEMK